MLVGYNFFSFFKAGNPFLYEFNIIFQTTLLMLAIFFIGLSQTNIWNKVFKNQNLNRVFFFILIIAGISMFSSYIVLFFNFAMGVHTKLIDDSKKDLDNNSFSYVVNPKKYIIDNFWYEIILNKQGSLISIMYVLLATLIGFFSLSALDSRTIWDNQKFMVFPHIILYAVLILTATNNVVVFFLAYECLLIPSYFLVYYTSPTERVAQAANWFLQWTQTGSLLVLCGIIIIVYSTGHTTFEHIKQNNCLSPSTIVILFICFFFGFGLKIPLWPFHYWLSKTHVEAPAGFSMFLSGFLVKAALYGLYKFFYSVDFFITGPYQSIATIFALIGVCDASFKLWTQTDLKKLVAFCTVQEMNLILLCAVFGNSYLAMVGLFFSVAHGFLSAAMFYLVDLTQRAYGTRLVTELAGVANYTPQMYNAYLIILIFYAGVPGTLKFTCEISLFVGMWEASNFASLITLVVSLFVGFLGFSKNWCNVLFGISINDRMKLPADLTKKDWALFWIIIFNYIFFTFTGLMLLQ